MPFATPRHVKDLLARYRADLEEVNRRIRILEWLVKGQEARETASA
jgi:hypothetical protein